MAFLLKQVARECAFSNKENLVGSRDSLASTAFKGSSQLDMQTRTPGQPVVGFKAAIESYRNPGPIN